MNIRQAIRADIPMLNELVNGAYRGESSKQGWTSETDLLGGIRTSEAGLQDMMQRKQAVILVAEESDNLQGCVFLQKQDEVLYLGMLTVSPSLQGKGLGAALLQAAENYARNAGCFKIKMTVLTVRNELIAYYERKDYYDTRVREPFPQDPSFGIPKQPLQFMVMEKSLFREVDSSNTQ